MKWMILPLLLLGCSACISIKALESNRLKVLAFKKYSCENLSYPSSQILSTQRRGDTLEIKLQAADNCNVDVFMLKGQCAFKEDTLNLFYDRMHPEFDAEHPDVLLEPIPEMECDCQFFLDYQLTGWESSNLPVIQFQNQILAYYKGYVILEKDTLNRIDKSGQKQGKWLLDLDAYDTHDYRFDYYNNDKKERSEHFLYQSRLDFEASEMTHITWLYYKKEENYLTGKGQVYYYTERGELNQKTCYDLSSPKQHYKCP